MLLQYRYRLYPTPGHEQALARAFGCARVVFNDALRVRETAFREGLPYLTDTELSKLVITQAKKNSERAWLGEVSTAMLQQALGDLNTAYRNFFASACGQRRGRRMEAPRPRSRKDGRQAIRFARNAKFKITEAGRLRLPKIGDVPVRWSRPLPAEPSSVSIIKDGAGRYFASFVVEASQQPLPTVGADVGIDLGLNHFAVLSDGRKISNPRWLRKAERKLRRAQQDLARKQKGSSNHNQAVRRVTRLHAKVADARREFHHQLSTWLIRENQAVYVEDLAVDRLSRTWLAKSVHDAGWASFVAMLEYKARKNGRTFTKVSRTFPSSQLCSICGHQDGPKPLAVRSWVCAACNALHDRDHNAALNVRNEGRRIVAAGRQAAPEMVRGAETLNACGDRVRPPFAVARVVEPGTHQKPEGVRCTATGRLESPPQEGGEGVNAATTSPAGTWPASACSTSTRARRTAARSFRRAGSGTPRA
ncbi:RNA-guided endonuclease InsQ/TnpB family protein [Actinomadura barringtoniae]|uniref:RNA-guided endonuclease InsQ/TnpB family protein n=1 Tax=Actinomadura barringtoniae TaxID=1427535 RepID=UPI0027DB0247|nr:RNA-guided endonuclease TnpB family protein [Actinomadura barringtoniae]